LVELIPEDRSGNGEDADDKVENITIHGGSLGSVISVDDNPQPKCSSWGSMPNIWRGRDARRLVKSSRVASALDYFVSRRA
jgi:hypothetical protein